MKAFFLFIIIAASSGTLKADWSFTQILNESEKTQVINLIQNACEKILCKKQYDFKFKDIICDENNFLCELNFQVMDRGFVPGKFVIKRGTCFFNGISRREQIISDNELNVNFYEDLNVCINNTISG